MITTQSRITQYSKRVVVELDDRLRAALDHVIGHRRRLSPLLPPDQSSVMREMIIEEYKRVTSVCPLCNGETAPHPDPTMTSVRYCPTCDQSVGYVPDNGGAARTQVQAAQ